MSYIPRLKKEYNDRIVSTLKDTFSYKSVMQVPKLKKIGNKKELPKIKLPKLK